MKKLSKLQALLVLVIGLALLSFAPQALAGGWGTDANDTVTFTVKVPLILYFALDKTSITFDLTNPALITPDKLGDGVTTVPADGSIGVALKTNTQTATISAAFPTAGELTSATSTDKIAIKDEIASNDGGTINVPDFSTYAGSNITAQTTVATGKIDLTDSWDFTYLNKSLYGAGDYTGDIVFTASIP
jgi:hypothetical protein